MSQQKITISINEINKIEGHAGFVANLEAGKIQKVRMEVKEGARFIEGILVGRKYTEAPWITSRICGICPTVHNLTSLKALEAALKMKPSPQTNVLRRLMLLGQFIQSHITHIYFLALGDFFNIKSDLALVKMNPYLAQKTIQIRGFANLILNIIGGRNIHPTTTTVGGFRILPKQKSLHKILANIEINLERANELFDFLNNLTFPQFQHLTTFVGLDNGKDYSLYDGKIKTGRNKKYTLKTFLKKAEEIQEEGDLVKKVKFQKETYLVGALSRLNLYYKRLNPEARRAQARAQFVLPCYNIFYNLLAQMIEVIHCIEEVEKLIKNLRIKNEKGKKYQIKAGEGLAATEAPRGTLFHYYKINSRGIIRACNIITPTAQFLPNLEEDLKEFLKERGHLEKQKEAIKMLIRAYDPCITCAVH